MLDGFCNLRAPVEHVHVNAQLFYRYRRYVPFLYDIDVDMCDYLGNGTKFQPIMEVMRGYIAKYTQNVQNQTCPVSGNVTVNALQYDLAMLRNVIIPTGQYRADLRVFDAVSNATIFVVQAFLAKVRSDDELGRG